MQREENQGDKSQTAVIDLCSSSSSEDDENSHTNDDHTEDDGVALSEGDCNPQEDDPGCHSPPLLKETNPQRCTPKSTTQKHGIIRSVKSACPVRYEKQTTSVINQMSPPVMKFEKLEPFQQIKMNIEHKDVQNGKDGNVSSMSFHTKKGESTSVEQVTSNVQDLSIDHCWSCDSKIYPNDGDLVCEHPLLGYVHSTLV